MVGWMVGWMGFEHHVRDLNAGPGDFFDNFLNFGGRE